VGIISTGLFSYFLFAAHATKFKSILFSTFNFMVTLDYLTVYPTFYTLVNSFSLFKLGDRAARTDIGPLLLKIVNTFILSSKQHLYLIYTPSILQHYRYPSYLDHYKIVTQWDPSRASRRFHLFSTPVRLPDCTALSRRRSSPKTHRGECCVRSSSN
jgi:hypothetical protein